MISSASWLQTTRTAVRRSQFPEIYFCSRCAASSRRLRSTALSSHVKNSEARHRILRQRREFHAGQPNPSASPGVLTDEKSANLFHSELTRKEDILTYLRNWKPPSPELNIDPIQNPQGLSGEPQNKWVGNMLRDEPMVNGERTKEFDMDAYQDPSSEDGHFPYLWPGNLVLLEQETGFSTGQLAVYVRTVNDQQQFYTDRGKWRVAHPNEMSFALGVRVPEEMITSILPYFPTSTVEKSFLPQLGLEGGVPRPAGRALLEWMESFEKAARKFYAQNSSLLDNVYDLVADEEEFRLLTLDEIGQEVFGRTPGTLTEAERYAIHKGLKRQAFYVVANQTHSTTESYTIRPKPQAKVVQTVVDWVRRYQDSQAREALGWGKGSLSSSPMHQFVQKARKLIYRSRKLRNPTLSFAVSPTVQGSPVDGKVGDMAYDTLPVEKFTENDQMILKFLRLWVTPPSLMTTSVLKTIGSMIIRSIEMYDGYPMTPQTGYLLLQEIGVVAPWENMHVLSELVALPGHGTSPASDRLAKKCNDFCETVTPDTFVDYMKDLRKDWGDLPVFCVDSQSTSEVDDGFSVEPVEGSNGEHWVHIHVANPSAFIPPNHILAKGAKYFKRSFYSPERLYPMLPQSVTQKHFSLGPDKPVLTFSAKLNTQGGILEEKIVNGYIRNVVYITPDRLAQLYGIDRLQAPRMTLQVGGEAQMPNRPELQDYLSEEHAQSLLTLQKLLSAHWEVRVKKGAMNSTSTQRSQPFVSGGNGRIKSLVVDGNEALQYTGDPIIHISGPMLDPLEILESTKQDLVSHAMVLGGEVAAKWCKERDIPLIFSGVTQRPEETVLRGILGGESTSTSMARFKGYLSPVPVPHTALGMEQYAKCTSPLRRFSDLLCHWQIEAGLRREAERKRPALERKDVTLPFSLEKVNAIISRSTWQNRLKDRAQSMSRDFWAMQLLFRAFNYGQAKLPETFQCQIVTQLLEGKVSKVKDSKVQYMGSLLPFRLRCCISMDPKMPPLQAGDVVDVKIQQANLYNVFLDVDFVKLVKRPSEEAAKGSGGFFI
ncbi:exoribonuclease R [Coccidioides immitis RMSCC 2394]|uniref:Exoribonuclease R n=1 Tax=Coccidioides immitis RMSCC 2394 TaxID=404692 RepID=A0A0J6YH20_COCIT|nr:exoribonuclease R [Coccidioides immitis RMSCC 2394]